MKKLLQVTLLVAILFALLSPLATASDNDNPNPKNITTLGL
jgi:hypothetical protein